MIIHDDFAPLGTRMRIAPVAHDPDEARLMSVHVIPFLTTRRT